MKRLFMLLPWLGGGGADAFNLSLSRMLSRRRWQLALATTVDTRAIWRDEFAKWVDDIVIVRESCAPRDDAEFIARAIQRQSPDVILVSHAEEGYALLPFLRARFPYATFVDYCHIEEPRWRDGGFPRMSLRRAQYLDHTLVSSRHLREWMLARGAAAERVSVCYTGVDTDFWQPSDVLRVNTRARFGVNDKTGVLVFAGRLVAQKQPALFVHAAHKLAQQGLDILALIAGVGPLVSSLRTSVERDGLHDRVRLLGQLTRGELRDVYAAADTFVLPSQNEGISLALAEAMLMGLVPIGADVGGQRELVTPDCGVLLASANSNAAPTNYANAIASLLADGERRRAMSQAARKRVLSEFSDTKMADNFEHIVAQATQARVAQHRPIPSVAEARASAGLAARVAWRNILSGRWRSFKARRQTPSSSS